MKQWVMIVFIFLKTDDFCLEKPGGQKKKILSNLTRTITLCLTVMNFRVVLTFRIFGSLCMYILLTPTLLCNNVSGLLYI